LFGAYASVALVCAGSLVVGQAILLLCGRRELTWLSGPVGLAALLVVSGLAIKLPGHGTAVAIVAGVLVAGCAAAGSAFLAAGTLLSDAALAVVDPRSTE